ncbi:uncharacterized [Tachysurus ichikawai]
MAPSAAATRLAERKETIAHTCCTAMQSSDDGSTPRRVKISLAFVNPSLLLENRMNINDDYYRIEDKSTLTVQ